ncbi:ABC transporter permease [Gorillibacterium timonense]|uniref:ABC transporter permease n=1 Tax=Gorillibacterium timonense TaxID=1689269 RepID=UPI00071CF62A|nr:ABC transporter permease [Gorillibacterium timonense]
MRGFWTVLKFTFMNRVKAKSFISTTIIFALLIAAGVNAPSVISHFSGDKTTNVGVFADSTISPALIEHFKKDDPKLVLIEYPDKGSLSANEEFAKTAVLNKEVKGFLVKQPAKEGEFPAFRYLSEGTFTQTGPSSKLQSALQIIKANEVVKEFNLTDEQVTKLNTPVSLESIQITSGSSGGGTGNVDGPGAEGKTPSEQLMSYILVYALMILLFMALSMYGNMTASEITAEKSSRVMEVLITSVSPLKQMFGKVFGMFLLGVAQIALFIAVAVINLNLPNNRDFFASNDLDFSSIDPMLYVYFVLFYLLGFFLYVILYAAMGSIVSRTEELGQAVMPITLLSLAGFYIGIYGINAPMGTFIRVCSFIPFFTPNIMFLRIGMLSNVPAWEIWLSIAILIASILFFGWLSAKIYRTGVLMYGKRPSIKEIRKAMKAYKL